MATMFDPMQLMMQQTPELLDLSRQRKMADMLMSKGLQAPQGQTVSGGVYVPPNPMEYLGNLFNVYAGSEANKALDVKQKEYADAIRNLESTESSNILQALQGTSEKVYPQQAGPVQDGSNIPQQMDAAVPGSTEAAYAAALRGVTPAAKSFVPILQKRLTQEPDWKETSINQNGNIIKGLYDANKGDVLSTFRPFNSSADISLKTAQYSGILPQGNVSSPIGMQSNQTSPFVSQAQSLGLPVISGIRNPLEQAELRHHRDPVTNQWMTKENRPVAENSAHFYGNAIDLKPNAPLDANQQAWLNQNAFRPNPTKDANHWEAKPNAGQMPAAGQQPTKYDLQPPASFNTPKERDEWFAESRKPLTGESATKAAGAVTTLTALDNYKGLIDKYSKEQFLSPDARATLNNAHAQLMLQLKDANGLGVLNKGDLPMLEKLIVNPNNMESLLLSKNVLDNQITGQKGFMRDIAANAYLNNGREVPPRIKQTLLNVDNQIEQATTAKEAQKTTQLGKPVVYNSQAAAQAAGKAGTLRDGQKVVIGGNVYTWKND